MPTHGMRAETLPARLSGQSTCLTRPRAPNQEHRRVELLPFFLRFLFLTTAEPKIFRLHQYHYIQHHEEHPSALSILCTMKFLAHFDLCHVALSRTVCGFRSTMGHRLLPAPVSNTATLFWRVRQFNAADAGCSMPSVLTATECPRHISFASIDTVSVSLSCGSSLTH